MSKTFLQLCQMVARESGTISSDNRPVTVSSQTGREGKIVQWVAQAWTLIQNSQDSWRWMRAEFTGALTAGTGRYMPASWNLDRFGRWLGDSPHYSPQALYKTALGVSDEGAIREIAYEEWRLRYGRGAQTSNRPVDYAISPMEEFCFGPVPNAAYTVRGEYMRSPQLLALDADVPELPGRYHDIIAYRALMLLADYDEAASARQVADLRYKEMLLDLQRTQLENITIGGGPIA